MLTVVVKDSRIGGGELIRDFAKHDERGVVRSPARWCLSLLEAIAKLSNSGDGTHISELAHGLYEPCIKKWMSLKTV